MLVITNFISVKAYYREHKGINILDYFYLIFRKVIKILPAYLTVFLALWAFIPFMSDAPAWYRTENAFRECKKNWIWNVLMIGNLVPWF
jgi:peptidoglycan/LPS O-acetylase OafA/YrhL